VTKRTLKRQSGAKTSGTRIPECVGSGRWISGMAERGRACRLETTGSLKFKPKTSSRESQPFPADDSGLLFRKLILEHAGFSVLRATGVDEALRLFNANPVDRRRRPPSWASAGDRHSSADEGCEGLGFFAGHYQQSRTSADDLRATPDKCLRKNHIQYVCLERLHLRFRSLAIKGNGKGDEFLQGNRASQWHSSRRRPSEDVSSESDEE
jgi:hypothetical protein